MLDRVHTQRQQKKTKKVVTITYLRKKKLNTHNITNNRDNNIPHTIWYFHSFTRFHKVSLSISKSGWRMRGVCEFASVVMECCDIYAYQTEPGGSFVKELYWSELSCNASRIENRSSDWIEERTKYCAAFWTCYATPSTRSIATGSLMDVDLNNMAVPYIWWLCSVRFFFSFLLNLVL